MLKQLFKIIWKQRRLNGWIFGEILIVLGLLWFIMDTMIVDLRTYHSPLGFDIENTYLLSLATMGEKSPGYVAVDEITETDAEELVVLMDRIRRHPAVEAVSASYYGFPYCWSEAQQTVSPVGVDSVKFKQRSFPIRFVTPGYFTVFRVMDKEGNDIPSQIDPGRRSFVISSDMEEEFYGNENGKGKLFRFSDDEEEGIVVAAVSQPFRKLDNLKSEPCLFSILQGSTFNTRVNQSRLSSVELCVRMKQTHTEDEMNDFLASMGDQLTVNNTYVTGAMPINVQRKDQLMEYEKESKTYMALVVFLLINVLFGIIGTFWLRTQYRKGEIGVRQALGSSKQGIYRFLNLEGLCLLIITLPFLLFFAGNMIWFDYLDSYRLPLTLGRMTLSFGGTYLLIAGMICLGISFSARKAVKMQPAETLHYE